MASDREHPGREEILRRHDADAGRVIAWLTGGVPEGKAIFYQKHMAHHLLPGMDRNWLRSVSNAFLIREPREMLMSLIRVTPEPSLEDTGLPQQWEIFERTRGRSGAPPPVVDARDVLTDPAGLLAALCDALGVPYLEAMLSWEPGPRDTDGVWAKHWYGAVEASTNFLPHTPKSDPLPSELDDLYECCRAIYDRLYAHRLTT
jgi:hypothetical protein